MRIRILPLLFGAIGAQTIFYQQDFNSGVPSDWSLNTSDLGSTTTLLYNRWVVGADYNGNDVDNPISSVPADPSYCCPTNCVGICAFLGCAALGCVSVSIPPIPNQPAAITGAPQSAFLHVSYDPTYGNACPPVPTTFSYLGPDPFSPCYSAANLFAKMSQPVAIPASATNVKLSFFWLAGGGTNAYGEVYYSTDGSTWTRLTSRNGSQQLRNNANSWYADTISLPASVAGQNLYIGFRFVNQAGSGHADPPLGVDEIRIFGDVPAIDITSIPPVVCAGNSVSIAFSTTGSFGAGNQFTVQLSDATGSFAAPLATATGAGSPISLTIPTTVATGSYKIRVVSSNPVVVSDPVDVNVVNLSNLTCSADPPNPSAGQDVTFTLDGTGLPTGPFNILLDIDNDGTADYTQNGVSLPYSFTHTYTTVGSYTAVFTLTHPGSGCTGTCEVTVNVGTPPPTIEITNIPPVPTVCAGSSVNVAFTTTGTFGAGNQFTVQLSDAAGSFTAPLATATGVGSPISLTIPTTVATGSYKIRVVSSNPVVVSDPVDVNVVNLSNLTCSADPPNPSAGQAVTFTLDGTGLPTGPFNISLDIDNDGTPDYTQNGVSLPYSFTHTYTTVGSYTAVFTLTHPGSGCTGTCEVTVNVGTPPPTIDITNIPPVPTVCAGSSVSIAFSTTGSFGAGNQFTVQLSDATGSFAAPLATATGASSPISLTIPTTVATGSYKIRVVSSNPVVVSDPVDVNVVNLSNLTCSADPPNPSAGQAVTFTLDGTGLPTGPFNILLDIDNDGTPDYTQNGVSLPYSFTHTYTTVGSYTAVFTLTHPGSGCTGTCEVTVNVGTPPPTIDITNIPPVPTVCAGSSVSIEFSTTGSFGAGNQFTVQLSDATGSFAAPLATATGASSPISLTIPTTVATGSYKIRVVSSNPVVVSDPVDVNVVNLSNLTCSANPPNPSAGQAVTFTLDGTGLPTGPFNISLDIDNDGTPDYTQNGVSLPYSFTHTYTATGTYTAVFTLTHPASGCRGSCQITVNVGAAPVLTLTSVQPSSVCAGGTISIQFSASGSFGAGNSFTAQLSDLSGSFANPTILGSGTSSPISAVIPVTVNSGTYQVRVVSSNPVVISNTQTLTITNIQSLRCNATPNPANAGQAVQIQLTGTGLPSGTLNVTFNPGDGSSPQSRSVSSLPVTFTHTYANPGNYNATFTVSEPVSQCVGSCSVPVQVQAPSSLSQAALMHIRLYPNPSRGGAFLEGVPVGWEVRVVTPLGQVLYRERSEGRTLHLPSLPQGFYLVEVGAVGSLRWVVLE